MRELYAWVPWFKELATTIARNSERALVDRARQVQWNPDASTTPLLDYGDDNIDPFSFIYTLATSCRSYESRKRICQSVTQVFDLVSDIPVESDDAFIFPQGYPGNTLFHRKGQGEPSLLWRLFRNAALEPRGVGADDFQGALRIGNVGAAKLTQALFLIHASEFMPYDGVTRLFHPDSSSDTLDWERYLAALRELHVSFPGCELYEINLFAYLFGADDLGIGGDVFQISTNTYGDGRDLWEDFKENNWVYTGGRDSGLGWDDYESDQTTRGKVRYPLEKPQRGDPVLVRNASEGKGIGIVYKNDYEKALTRDSRLHVVWLNKTQARLDAEWTLNAGFSHANKIADAFRAADAYRTTFERLDRHRGGMGGVKSRGAGAEAPPDREPARAIHPRNQILYGPPGTGKTWNTLNLALAILDGVEQSPDRDEERFRSHRFDPVSGDGNIAMVTFHQNFAYEDFVEGIRPVLDGGQRLRYDLYDGIFKRLADAAVKRPSQRFVLIIDEINRGNIAKIFGELITLIEDSRRIGQSDETFVTLPYSKQDFGVPENLYLICTMNTADRSIQLLDTALRRRFTFIEMMPNPEHGDVPRDVHGVNCTRMLKAINERIAVLLDREHQIGHTYLRQVYDLEELSRRFRNQIFPLLQEYFFDDWSKVRAVLGDNAFVVERTPSGVIRNPDLVDEDRKVYERLPDGDEQWATADAYRAIYETGPGSSSDGT